MRSINFENLIRKHFGGVNREGLGYLKPGLVIVEMAIEDHEVSFNNLSINDFKIKDRKIIFEAATIIYQGKLGNNVLKHAPRNHQLKDIQINEPNMSGSDSLNQLSK